MYEVINEAKNAPGKPKDGGPYLIFPISCKMR